MKKQQNNQEEELSPLVKTILIVLGAVMFLTLISKCNETQAMSHVQSQNGDWFIFAIYAFVGLMVVLFMYGKRKPSQKDNTYKPEFVIELQEKLKTVNEENTLLKTELKDLQATVKQYSKTIAKLSN